MKDSEKALIALACMSPDDWNQIMVDHGLEQYKVISGTRLVLEDCCAAIMALKEKEKEEITCPDCRGTGVIRLF